MEGGSGSVQTEGPAPYPRQGGLEELSGLCGGAEPAKWTLWERRSEIWWQAAALVLGFPWVYGSRI